MKQRKGKRSFIKRRICSLFLVLVLLIAFGVQPAFAATSYVSNISITLNVDPVPGESLPGLSVGYIGDDCDVMISNNSKYDIKSAKWSVSKEEVRLGGKYTMKITLEAINDYRFNSSYSSSKVTVKGGTFVSAQKQSSTKLVVTVKTKEAKGTLESPEEAYWVNYSYGRDKFGYAKWEDVDNAAYDVYLYRGSKVIKKVTDLHSTTYNFYPYMTSKGTYSFTVRSIPVNSEVGKFASRSEWTYSDEIYIDEDEVSDGTGKDSGSSKPGYKPGNPGNQDKPETTQVGWILYGDKWYFRYPDGTYITSTWARIGGVWYLFDDAGVMQTGWKLCDGNYYFMDASGAMRTGWLYNNDAWYYLLEDGRMATGWIQTGELIYYLYSNGAMATGWQSVDGNIYYFYPDGHRATNEVIDGFYVDANGIWIRP